jgi:hypothetical protein
MFLLISKTFKKFLLFKVTKYSKQQQNTALIQNYYCAQLKEMTELFINVMLRTNTEGMKELSNWLSSVLIISYILYRILKFIIQWFFE